MIPKFLPPRNPGSLAASRRSFLAAAGGAWGAFWAGWLRAAAKAPGRNGKARSVILIFNCGGPSHLDLWDPKPDASDAIRGPFQPIETNVPGIQVSEIIPKLAQRTDKLAIVRSVHHTHSGHNSGMYWSIVGRPYKRDDTLMNPSPSDYPSFGTLVGWLAQRDGYSGAVPPYVITPYPHCDSTVYVTPGQYGGCLGVRYDPFVLDADPNAADFRVRDLGLQAGITTDHFRERMGLFDQFAASTRPVASSIANDLDVFRTRAASMVFSGEAARAFDLSQEPASMRERYGRHQWGQSHLLARRLIEAGVPFVSTVNGRSIIWDTHTDNFGRMQKSLVPPMEQAFAALLDDLAERGLLETTLVVWMGDFGRTPIINKAAGRDHWPQCFSAVLAGGGIRGGQVIGRSDSTGAFPSVRPISPADIHATVFTALGYDPHGVTYQTADGRPTPLSEGETIRELL
ncbi:MAG TPA: DUF1501 domain-containing protein [Planctomycetaceae bacterium]|nr:DUF1501 domain-containing protein [Planctomycetaceae bacterium]